MRSGHRSAIRAFVCLLAISAGVQAQQYVFHAYRQAEGLRNMVGNAMTVDRNGFVWVATENGVYRFLGSSFERFGVEQGIAGETPDIYADPEGLVWVATEENLLRWDGQNFLPAGAKPIHIRGPRRIASEDARHLLVVEGTRLYRLEHDAGGKMLSYLPVFSASMVAAHPELAKVSSLSVINDPRHGESIWLGCGNKLYSLPAGRFGGHTPQAENAAVTEWSKNKGLGEDEWRKVIVDRGGTLWAAGLHKVAALPPGARRFVDRSIPGSSPGNIYGHSPLLEDPQGRILAPADQGIARWDGARWRSIGLANGLERNTFISSMVFDTTGDLWLASRGDGLFQWTGYADWEGWSYDQGLPSASVWATLPIDKDRMLIGTEKGPAVINLKGGAARPFFTGSRWNFGPVITMGFNGDGSLFAGTMQSGIFRIDPKTKSITQTAKLPKFIQGALKDSSGRVFFLTKQGLYLSDSKAAPHRVAAVDALLGDSNNVDDGCISPDGVSWFLGNNRIVRFKDGVWSAPLIDGLPKPRGKLLDLACAADGALWITGGQTGTWRLSREGERLQARQLALPPELRSLAPLAILVDRRGWVWLGTDQGVVVWNGSSWRHLTEESGLIWNDINQGSLWAGSDGSLWIGTSGGLSHLMHPEHIFDPAPLAVSVTGIRRGNEVFPVGPPITLPWAALPLYLQISSPAMRNRSDLVFKYRMVGLQSAWIESQNGLVVYYALQPGNYTFEAVVSNAGLEATSAVVRVVVRILPPWWKSNWFYALCILASLIALWAACRLNERHLLEKSRRLEELVSERTRELEGSRAQLQIQATHDGLTGMLNRVAILRALAAEMDRARREERTVAVALIDLDHFKSINDTYGHLAGDDALRWFAAAVGAAIRPYDHAGRYGGEEFLLVLTEIPCELTEQRLASLQGSISNLQIRTRGFVFSLTCSMGATLFDPSDPFAGLRSAEGLLAIADQALYDAKAKGRNRVVFLSAIHQDDKRDGKQDTSDRCTSIV